MKYILGALLLLASEIAGSCTCYGTEPIELAIARHPILVEGQVVALDREDDEEFGQLTYSATLRVKRVLKGSVDTDEITVVHTMCYASLTPDDMELNRTYVLPLEKPAPERSLIPDEGYAVATVGLEPGQHEMAKCAHSGLEVIDGDLYTFEYDKGRDRRLQFYMPHMVFRALLPAIQATAFGFIGPSGRGEHSAALIRSWTSARERR